LPSFGSRVAVAVDDLHLDAEDAAALLEADAVAFLGRQCDCASACRC
jgi:hypothetical protein